MKKFLTLTILLSISTLALMAQTNVVVRFTVEKPDGTNQTTLRYNGPGTAGSTARDNQAVNGILWYYSQAVANQGYTNTMDMWLKENFKQQSDAQGAAFVLSQWNGLVSDVNFVVTTKPQVLSQSETNALISIQGKKDAAP